MHCGKTMALWCRKMQGKQGCGLTNRPVVEAGGGGGTVLKTKSDGCTLLPRKQTKMRCFKCKQLEEVDKCIPNVGSN